MHSRAFFLASIIDVEATETDTSFLTSKLQTLVYVVFFLIAVETRDLTFVLLPFSLFVSNLGHVDSSGRGSRVPGISLVFILLFLLIFSGFIRRLGLLGRSGGLKNLGVIPAIQCRLHLDLVDGDMGRSIPSKTIQISFLHVKT